MYNIPDHPMIRNIERTGYPFGFCEEEVIGYCERCGKKIYEYDRYGQSWPDQHLVCEDCLFGDDEPLWEEE